MKGCDRLGYMPHGLGQLTCLRTLSKFVVGKKKGRKVGELNELEGLQKLQGEVEVSCLENAAIPEPGSSYLKDKLNLKSLQLRWSWHCREDDVIDIVKDEIVFECLQPHPNLENLEVLLYPGLKISSWLSSIIKLTQLSLHSCYKCKHLPALHQLSSLKLLLLSRLEALENVSETEMQNESFSSVSTTFFPSLEELYIDDCPNLKGWWRPDDVGEASNMQPPYFPCLSNITIGSCPNLISMPLFPSVRKLRLGQTRWKSLIELTMKMKSATSELAPSSSTCSTFTPFCKLETLRLEDMEELDSLPEEFLQNLTSLQLLHIKTCSNLTSMPEGMRQLTSLKELLIRNCLKLAERCRRDGGVDWPYIAHIKHIWIW